VFEASGIQADPFSYQIDGRNFPTRYEADGLPDGPELDTTTGLIFGQSRLFGTFEVAITAFNAAGGRTETLTLNLEEKQPPQITSALSLERSAYQEIRLQIEGTNLPQSFTAEGLPEGVTIDPDSGFIFGFPSEIGDFPVTIEATNFTGTATETLQITVTENEIPIWLGSEDRVFRLGEKKWSLDIFATHDGDGGLVHERLRDGEDA
jgi:hypothetical protein